MEYQRADRRDGEIGVTPDGSGGSGGPGGLGASGGSGSIPPFLAELRRLRDVAGLGQAELAARAHYPQAVIVAAETGPSLPELPVLSAYVRGCGRPATEVAEWEDRWRSVQGETASPLLPARPPAGDSDAAMAGARIGATSAAADNHDPAMIMAALDRFATSMAKPAPRPDSQIPEMRPAAGATGATGAAGRVSGAAGVSGAADGYGAQQPGVGGSDYAGPGQTGAGYGGSGYAAAGYGDTGYGGAGNGGAGYGGAGYGGAGYGGAGYGGNDEAGYGRPGYDASGYAEAGTSGYGTGQGAAAAESASAPTTAWTAEQLPKRTPAAGTADGPAGLTQATGPAAGSPAAWTSDPLPKRQSTPAAGSTAWSAPPAPEPASAGWTSAPSAVPGAASAHGPTSDNAAGPGHADARPRTTIPARKIALIVAAAVIVILLIAFFV